MKKIIIPLLFCITSFSQNDVQNVKVIKDDSQVKELINSLGKNEVKLDVIDILSQPALNVSYERILDSYSSFGGDIFINFNDNSSSVSLSDRFSISPFYRFYFLNKQDFGGAGFFVELFSKFSLIEDTIEYLYYDPNTLDPYYEFDNNNYFDIAFGVGVGRKWINKKGITFELMFGVARFLELHGRDDESLPFGASDAYYSHRPRATIKGGISIGKRF